MNQPATRSAKEIFIASNSTDEAVYGRVAKILEERGHRVTVYQSDLIASGGAAFSCDIHQSGSLTITLDGKALAPDTVDVAWYRRPNVFSLLPPTDVGLRLMLDRDRSRLQSMIWDAIPESRWFNSRIRMQEADLKPLQLMVAAKLGFHIPRTIVTNDWSVVKSLPKDRIFKAGSPQLFINNKLHANSTTRLRGDTSLPTVGNPFPGYWQPYIPKKKEWRITVVGDTFFDAAIYTKKIAKADWRLYQQDDQGSVRFVHETFPEELKKKCLAYLRHFKLRFGAFDFIETPDGEIVFLECNPNGQFTWIEDELGLPISERIANELETIACRTGR